MAWVKSTTIAEGWSKSSTTADSFTADRHRFADGGSWNNEGNYVFTSGAFYGYFDQWENSFDLSENYFGRTGLTKNAKSGMVLDPDDDGWTKS